MNDNLEQKQMDKFNIDYYLILKYFVFTVTIVFLILIFIPIEAELKTYTALLIFLSYPFFLISSRIPVSISLDKENGILMMKVWSLFLLREEKYQYVDLVCTYQIEVGARGGKSSIFRFTDKQGKVLLKIVPNFSGWSNVNLLKIHNQLLSEPLIKAPSQHENPAYFKE
jgi:hypothetical protein